MAENLLNWLDTADKDVTLILNFDGGSVADVFFKTISNTLAWIPILLLFLYLLRKATKDNLQALLMIIAGLILTVTLCDKISAEIIKPMVMRLRPSHNFDISSALHYICENDYPHLGVTFVPYS